MKLRGEVAKEKWPAREPWLEPGWKNTAENWFCFALAQATAFPNPKPCPIRELTIHFYDDYYNGSDHLKIFYHDDPFVTFTTNSSWLEVLNRYMADKQLMAFRTRMCRWPCDGNGCDCVFE